jgi:hypothetical protein
VRKQRKDETKNEILKEEEWDRRRTLDLGSVRRKGEHGGRELNGIMKGWMIGLI